MKNKLNQRIIKGRPLIVNAGISRAYKRQLRKLVRRSIILTRILMKKLVPQIKETYAQDSIVDNYYDELKNIRESIELYIDEYAPVYLGEVFEEVDKNSTHNLAMQMSKMFRTEMPSTVIPDINQPIMRAWVHKNVELIKKITSNYFDQISDNVMKIFTTGIPRETLTSEIYKIGQTTLRRADLICEDQISKAYMSLNLQKFRDAGITKFEWVHTHGGLNPRLYHLNTLDGQIFDVNNPPIIDKRTGERGFPGQAPFCRCVMRPVVSYSS